jgi:threonine/homoserine/homoserine lactone efflux protein
LYLAWQAVKPGGRSPFQVRDLPQDSTRRLLAMGLFTNLLNPKAAMLYLSLLPQFIEPGHGSVLFQSLMLGTIQISLSLTVNALIVLTAGTVAAFLGSRPTWQTAQRWIMGSVLVGLAVRMAVDSRR